MFLFDNFLIYFWSFLIVKVFSDTSSVTQKPNVIFILVDDWGYNDVGYFGNTDISTPNIDSFANDGVTVLSHYVHFYCTPSRAAFLTGRYSFRYGLQMAITSNSEDGINVDETLISNEFQNNGYKTSLIGKWHVGYSSWLMTPTFRGFDYFFGYYNAYIDYYQHNTSENNMQGYDFRRNTDSIYQDYENDYSLNIFKNEIFDYLNNYEDEQDPFFMFISWQAAHFPYKAYPESEEDLDPRDIAQDMIEYTDTMLGELITNLKNLNMWDNTLIIITSDNGGNEHVMDNSPFRGEKGSLFEGGVHLWAFINGGYLNEEQHGKIIKDQYMHIIDWYPTLLDAANIQISNDKTLDGISMWNLIQFNQINDEMINRDIVLNVNSEGCKLDYCGGLIYNNQWKLIYSNTDLESYEWTRTYAIDSSNSLPWNCGNAPNATIDSINKLCSDEPCLFDLINDPCEYNDVHEQNEDLTQLLMEKLQSYYEKSVPSNLLSPSHICANNDCDPVNFNSEWTPWLDILKSDNTVVKKQKPHKANNILQNVPFII